MYAPSTALLDLGHVELEEAVQPCEEFLAVWLHHTSVTVVLGNQIANVAFRRA